MNILIADAVSAAAVDVLRAQPDWNVIVSSPKEFEAHLAEADALLIRSAVKVTREVLARAPKLRVIGRAGVGVDNVDQETATAQGVVGGNIDGVTRVMTTAIALETSKGDLPLALGLGLVLVCLVMGINAAAQAIKTGAQRRYG